MVCNKCKKENSFRLDKTTGKDFTICKECQNERQRLYRSSISNLTTKTYEKTENGFIMRMYRNMKSRVNGVQKKCAHIYKGLDILSKDEFYTWINKSETFKELFDNYKNNNFSRRLSPTVDRINPDLGYTLDNMQILTLSDNVKLARPNTKFSKIDIITIRELAKTNSIKDIMNKYDSSRTVISNMINYKTFNKSIYFNLD
jgi:hypothetical protein